ncbi:MAG: glycosyltransferase family 2 protein [Gemmatimonadetes bacterium]|nr:glycosyltransferase family 2 protein [Gemmatimonadota bacterium]
MPDHRWTISILTIPGREEWLGRLVESLMAARVDRRARLGIVFNRDVREDPAEVERQLRRTCGRAPIDVSFNMTAPTIASGRQAQLNACRTERIAFVDDDVTVHGDLLDALDDALARAPLALVGIPSFVNDTAVPFKPRDTTPGVTRGDVRYMTVQGMLAAGYRRLLLDVGGFNQRRRFWGEWTELNLRLWRLGYPTGYVMDGPYLRHWERAPDSPTRNRAGREMDILWGLICTALEFDADTITDDTASFWKLVEQRYLAYAFGPALNPQVLLSATLQLAPQLSAEWAQIMACRDLRRRDPFPFAPFQVMTEGDVAEVCARAEEQLGAYRGAATVGSMASVRWRDRVRRGVQRLRTA